MSDKILINRYASRRLYNTSSSEYVTLEEVAVLIRDGKDIEIRDKKSGEDLTRQYLLQIITEQESRGETVLPVNVLMDLVRSYSSGTQNFLPDFLANSLDAVKEQQAKAVDQLSKAMPDTFDPMALFGSASEWQKKQSEIMCAMMSSWMPNQPQSGAQPDPTPDGKDDVAAIKAQLDALQEKLKNL